MSRCPRVSCVVVRVELISMPTAYMQLSSLILSYLVYQQGDTEQTFPRHTDTS